MLRKAFDKPNLSKILCLQETHQINRFALDNHFQGKFVIDDGERDQRGTAILVSEQFEVMMSRTSGIGRWSLAVIREAGDVEQLVVVASVYAPNCHREASTFFEGFFEALDEFCTEVADSYNWPHIIIAGDFNFVFNPNVDALNRQSSQSELALATLVSRLLDEKDLTDSIIFREQAASRFTWRRGICCSRLDYIFVSTGLRSQIDSQIISWHEFGSRYDHAAVSIDIKEKSVIPRGRGYPKLFNSDIRDSRSVIWLLGQLEAAKLQIPTYWNPHQAHDFLKMSLRSKALELRAMNRKVSSVRAITERINSTIQSSTV